MATIWPILDFVRMDLSMVRSWYSEKMQKTLCLYFEKNSHNGSLFVDTPCARVAQNTKQNMYFDLDLGHLDL